MRKYVATVGKSNTKSNTNNGFQCNQSKIGALKPNSRAANNDTTAAEENV